MRRKVESNFPKRIKIKTSFGLASIAILLSVFLVTSNFDNTNAALTKNATVSASAKSTTIKSPTNLKVSNVRVGETDLSWTPSTSEFTTGYKVLRSNNVYGPWTMLGEVEGRTASKFIDKTSAAKSWFYRVEAKFGYWNSVSPGYEAPPAVGLYFYDSFDTDLGLLDGRVTEDGKSVWQVWSGSMTTEGSNITDNGAAYGTPGYGPSPNNGDVAVVRTPTTDAWVYATDFDGYERFIVRGKDPQNYIYAGGSGLPDVFEIGIVKDGVKSVKDSGMPGRDKDFRLEIKGDAIHVYINPIKGDPNSGTLYMHYRSSELVSDNTSTYFGIGFTRGGMGINDFTFEAL